MGTLHTLTPPSSKPPPAKPVLHPLARLNVERARQFLMELPASTPAADPMFLLGRCAEHAQALLDVVDAVTELPR